MVAYAGTYTPRKGKVVCQIDISWNQSWTETAQVRFFELGGNRLTITPVPCHGYLDGLEGPSILMWDREPPR